jgi:uncharacterized membrane protein YkgB
MTNNVQTPRHDLEIHGDRLANIGKILCVYGLALVFLWIGAMKFTGYEARAVQGLINSSPLLSWLYDVTSVRGAGYIIGVSEIFAGLMIAARPFKPILGVLGGGLAAATTLLTLTFLFSAPGWEPTLGGFPALSVVPGQFLLKDIVLLGVGLWIAGDALNEVQRQRAAPINR